jgi:hypothetical protein
MVIFGVPRGRVHWWSYQLTAVVMDGNGHRIRWMEGGDECVVVMGLTSTARTWRTCQCFRGSLAIVPGMGQAFFLPVKFFWEAKHRSEYNPS